MTASGHCHRAPGLRRSRWPGSPHADEQDQLQRVSNDRARAIAVWRGAQSFGAVHGIVRGWTIGLREPQRGSLIPPIEGQSGVGHQLVGREPRRLLPCKDRGDNISSEGASQP